MDLGDFMDLFHGELGMVDLLLHVVLMVDLHQVFLVDLHLVVVFLVDLTVISSAGFSMCSLNTIALLTFSDSASNCSTFDTK